MIASHFPIITSLYASLLALFFILLSLRVIALRGNPLFAVLKRAGDH